MNDAPTSQLRLAAVTVMTIAALTFAGRRRAVIHGRLMQLGPSVRLQRKRVGALFERGQHLCDLPDGRRFHGWREQPDDRSAVRRLQLLRPRLHRAGGHDDHSGPLGRPARPQQLHMGHVHASRAERSSRPRPPKRPALRPDRLRHQQLPDHLPRPLRHNPPRTTGHLRSRHLQPRRSNALPRPGGNDRRPTTPVDLTERAHGERAVGKRAGGERARGRQWPRPTARESRASTRPSAPSIRTRRYGCDWSLPQPCARPGVDDFGPERGGTLRWPAHAYGVGGRCGWQRRRRRPRRLGRQHSARPGSPGDARRKWVAAYERLRGVLEKSSQRGSSDRAGALEALHARRAVPEQGSAGNRRTSTNCPMSAPPPRASTGYTCG